MDENNSFDHLPDSGSKSDNTQVQAQSQQPDNSFVHLPDAPIQDPLTWHRSKEELDSVAEQGKNQSTWDALGGIFNPQGDAHRATMAKIYQRQYGDDWYDKFNRDIKDQDIGAAGLRQGVEGVPILGALVEKTPVMQKLEQEDPTMSKARKIIGGAASMIPAVAAAPEVFGAAAGQSLLARMGMGALSNSAIGGADTALRGGSTKDVENSMINSGLLGAGLPAVASGVARGWTIGRNAIGYGNRVVENARNSQLASDRDIIGALDDAKLTPQQLMETLHNHPNLNEQQLSDIVSRGQSGDSIESIAKSHNISPEEVENYLGSYKRNNPTPMNIMDLASEVGGPGRAQPLTREARSSQIISRDADAAQKLYQRQQDQPARVTGIVNEVLPNPSTAEDVNAAQRIAQQRAINVIENEYPGQTFEKMAQDLASQHQKEAASAFGKLRNSPPVIADEDLAKTMITPLAKKYWEKARTLAEAEGQPIPTYDEMANAYGIRGQGGVGLTPKKGVNSGDVSAKNAAINAARNVFGSSDGLPEPQQNWYTSEPFKAIPAPGLVIPPNALLYFQRALRLDAERIGGSEGTALNALRQRVIGAVDDGTQNSLIPGFRDTLNKFREGKSAEEAMQKGSNINLEMSTPTRNSLSEFDNMNKSEQELARVGLARKIQDTIQNSGYGSKVLDKFDNLSAQQVVRHVFGEDTGERILKGLANERLTANAMSNGEELATKLSSANSRDVMREFSQMDTTQQDLFRRGFSRRLRSLINAKNEGQDVTSQFNNTNTKQLISQILPHDEAQFLIKNLGRENITTQTKNAIYGNSNTAQTEFDLNSALSDARAARALASGKIGHFMDYMGEKLARIVGKQKAAATIKTLTETDPPAMLQNLQRLATVAKSEGERDIYQQMLKEFKANAVQNAPYAIAPLNAYLNQQRNEDLAISRARAIVGKQ